MENFKIFTGQTISIYRKKIGSIDLLNETDRRPSVL